MGKGILIKCHKCGYIWTFKGKSPFYACCSRCRYQVPIKNNRLDGVKDSQTKLSDSKK